MFKKIDKYGFHPIVIVVIAFIFILSCWFFFWPIVECIYAGSWSPLIEGGMTKACLFVFGGAIFFASAFVTGKMVI